MQKFSKLPVFCISFEIHLKKILFVFSNKPNSIALPVLYSLNRNLKQRFSGDRSSRLMRMESVDNLQTKICFQFELSSALKGIKRWNIELQFLQIWKISETMN